jgi:hypothetical protein
MANFEFRFRPEPLAKCGEDLTAGAILRKRREFELKNPTYPKWQSEESHMAQVQKHGHHAELDQIIDDANEGRVGKDATHLRLVDHFSKHHYSMTDLRKDGDPRSVEQQMERWHKFAPEGKRAAAAVKEALLDTASEKQAALRDHLDDHQRAANRARGGTDLADVQEHERRKHPGSGEHVATKIDKNVQFGPNAALSMTNNPAWIKLDKMAGELQKRLKSEQGKDWSREQCFSFLANETASGRYLMKVDKLLRLGAAVA